MMNLSELAACQFYKNYKTKMHIIYFLIYKIQTEMNKIQKRIKNVGIDRLIEISVPIMDYLAPIKWSPNQKYDNKYFLICLLDFVTTSVSWRAYKGTITHPINGRYLNQIHNKFVTNKVYDHINKAILKEYFKTGKEDKMRIQIMDSSFIANKGGSVKNNNHLLSDKVKKDNAVILEKNRNLPRNRRSRKKIKPETFIDFNRYNGRKKYIKVSSITNEYGVPLGTAMISAKQSDSISVTETVSELKVDLNTLRNSKVNRYKQYMLMDAQYDSKDNRAYLEKSGYVPIIAHNKRNTKNKKILKIKKMNASHKKIYKKRRMVESYFAWIKNFPCINQLYEKTISSYKGLFMLASSIVIAKHV